MSTSPLKLQMAITVIAEGEAIYASTAGNAASVLLAKSKEGRAITVHSELRIAAGKVLLEAFVDLTKRVAELERRPPQVIRYQEGLGP